MSRAIISLIIGFVGVAYGHVQRTQQAHSNAQIWSRTSARNKAYFAQPMTMVPPKPQQFSTPKHSNRQALHLNQPGQPGQPFFRGASVSAPMRPVSVDQQRLPRRPQRHRNDWLGQTPLPKNGRGAPQASSLQGAVQAQQSMAARHRGIVSESSGHNPELDAGWLGQAHTQPMATPPPPKHPTGIPGGDWRGRNAPGVAAARPNSHQSYQQQQQQQKRQQHLHNHHQQNQQQWQLQQQQAQHAEWQQQSQRRQHQQPRFPRNQHHRHTQQQQQWQQQQRQQQQQYEAAQAAMFQAAIRQAAQVVKAAPGTEWLGLGSSKKNAKRIQQGQHSAAAHSNPSNSMAASAMAYELLSRFGGQEGLRGKDPRAMPPQPNFYPPVAGINEPPIYSMHPQQDSLAQALVNACAEQPELSNLVANAASEESENTGPVNLSPLAFEIMACLQGSRPHPSNGGPSDAEIKSA